MIEKTLLIIYLWAVVAVGSINHQPMFFNYLLAGFGWLLYVVGRLYFTRGKYDINDDGLSWTEVKAYLKKGWIGFLFNGMLLAVAVPYAESWWPLLTGLFEFSQGWPFTELVYLVAGCFILVVQVIVDIVSWKLGTMKK